MSRGKDISSGLRGRRGHKTHLGSSRKCKYSELLILDDLLQVHHSGLWRSVQSVFSRWSREVRRRRPPGASQFLINRNRSGPLVLCKTVSLRPAGERGAEVGSLRSRLPAAGQRGGETRQRRQRHRHPGCYRLLTSHLSPSVLCSSSRLQIKLFSLPVLSFKSDFSVFKKKAWNLSWKTFLLSKKPFFFQIKTVVCSFVLS